MAVQEWHRRRSYSTPDLLVHRFSRRRLLWWCSRQLVVSLQELTVVVRPLATSWCCRQAASLGHHRRRRLNQSLQSPSLPSESWSGRQQARPRRSRTSTDKHHLRPTVHPTLALWRCYIEPAYSRRWCRRGEQTNQTITLLQSNIKASYFVALTIFNFWSWLKKFRQTCFVHYKYLALCILNKLLLNLIKTVKIVLCFSSACHKRDPNYGPYGNGK